MYAELRARLPDRIALCEPQITVERHGCFVPDLVVLEGHTVAAIVELKFVPHGYPVYELDLRKLSVLAECQQGFQLRLDPRSGNFTEDTYHISANCILAFAAIGKHDAAAVDSVSLVAAMGPLNRQFMPLVYAVGG